MRLVASILAGFVVSLIAGGLIIASIGVDPWRALDVGIRGAVGIPLGLSNSLVFATPRLLVALGAAVAMRSGLFNLGVEGQLQIGAVGAAAVGVFVGPLVPPAHLALAILAAGTAGGVWAAIAGCLKIWRGADELIVTLMMSFIATYFAQYLVQGPFQAPGSSFAYSPRIAASAELPRLMPETRLHLGFVIALLCVGFVSFLLYRTTLGTQLRALGLNARAARLAGLPISRLIVVSMFCSGFVAGLAGAAEILGVQFRLIQGFSPGFGFEGLAIAFLANLEPLPILIVALFFGALQNAVTQLQQTLKVPGAVALIMEALPIVVLAAARGLWLVHGTRGLRLTHG